MMNRRQVLLSTGGAAILVVGGFAGTMMMRDVPEVREPWAQAEEGFGDVRLNALAYAILAPNAHNRQPWWVELVGDDSLTLYCDLNRLLPETDPPNRQITIGLGAFLELLRMAAAEQGYRTQIIPFPEGEPFPTLDQRPIASVRFIENSSVDRDPLFATTLRRRTNRAPFSDQTPEASHLAELEVLSGLAGTGRFAASGDGNICETLKAIAAEAWRVESNLNRTHMESIHLTRIGGAEVAANPDGISLYGPMMETYKTLGFLSRDGMAEIGSDGHKAGQKFYMDAIQSATAFGWLMSKDNTRADQLNAGADWVRLNLAATQIGLAFHPLSQALQEFPEMEPHFTAIHEFAGVDLPARVQGLFRLGYAKDPRPSPRWPVQSRIKSLA